MQLSQRGLDFIKRFEGFEPRPYNDGYGYMTIGYGHRIKPGERFTVLSEAEALQLLAQDTAWATAAVSRLVRVPLTQAMFDALVSLVFNWGESNFAGSSLLRMLNAGDYQAAAHRLSEHPITSAGKVSNGLIRRRKEESTLFLSEGIPGENPTRPLPVRAAAKKTDGSSTAGRNGEPKKTKQTGR